MSLRNWGSPETGGGCFRHYAIVEFDFLKIIILILSFSVFLDALTTWCLDKPEEKVLPRANQYLEL